MYGKPFQHLSDDKKRSKCMQQLRAEGTTPEAGYPQNQEPVDQFDESLDTRTEDESEAYQVQMEAIPEEQPDLHQTFLKINSRYSLHRRCPHSLTG